MNFMLVRAATGQESPVYQGKRCVSEQAFDLMMKDSEYYYARWRFLQAFSAPDEVSAETARLITGRLPVKIEELAGSEPWDSCDKIRFRGVIRNPEICSLLGNAHETWSRMLRDREVAWASAADSIDYGVAVVSPSKNVLLSIAWAMLNLPADLAAAHGLPQSTIDDRLDDVDLGPLDFICISTHTFGPDGKMGLEIHQHQHTRS